MAIRDDATRALEDATREVIIAQNNGKVVLKGTAQPTLFDCIAHNNNGDKGASHVHVANNDGATNYDIAEDNRVTDDDDDDDGGSSGSMATLVLTGPHRLCSIFGR